VAGNLDNLVRLTGKNAKAAAEMLANAFHDYPESVYITPDAEKRRKRLPRVYHLVMKNAVVDGEVYAASPKMEGVAVWYFIEGEEMTWRRGFSLGWLWQSLFMLSDNNKRQGAYWQFIHELRARIVPARYWYLMMMAVESAERGKDYAGRLLRPMLARMDREDTTCYLDTQVEPNVRLYEHFGFKVKETGIIPGTDIPYWAMLREPVKN
jgi:GNAT superfamily N-acetyltransferase